jgi:hypothetical protein
MPVLDDDVFQRPIEIEARRELVPRVVGEVVPHIAGRHRPDGARQLTAHDAAGVRAREVHMVVGHDHIAVLGRRNHLLVPARRDGPVVVVDDAVEGPVRELLEGKPNRAGKP